MALLTLPLLFKSERFIRERMQKKDPAKHGVVCLGTDPYWEVVENTRRYPGWVIVFVVYPPPSGSGEARVEIREFLPRQAQPVDVQGNPDMTIGEAFEMLARAEANGVDLLARNSDFAGSFEGQRPVPA